MFEQDYIMRLIKELVRTILKLIFHIETESPTGELLKDSEQTVIYEKLLDMVDSGNINDAENQLYDMTCDGDLCNMEVALLFYSYLNDKSDEFLEMHNFKREEIVQGIKDLTARYGLAHLDDVFLMDM